MAGGSGPAVVGATSGSSQVYVTGSSAPAINIQNTGNVAGTNAPYIQLLACEKI